MICFALIIKTQTGQVENMDFSIMLDSEKTATLMQPYQQFVHDVDGKPVLDFEQLSADDQAAFRKSAKAAIADSGMSFPMMVNNVLPAGARGIVVAGLLAALMSSLAGVFNASATLFTMDFYRKLRPEATEHALVRIGRIATTVMVIIGIMWIPVIRGSKGLYDYLQSVQGYLAPPIFVVFFLGIFWKRLNAAGCLSALIVGFLLGLFRMLVDTPAKVYTDYSYTEGSFLWIVSKIYFQYYSLIVFLVSGAIMVVVSYATAKPDYERISGLTYGTVTDDHRASSRSSWGTGDVLTSCLVMVLILIAYLYFNG